MFCRRKSMEGHVGRVYFHGKLQDNAREGSLERANHPDAERCRLSNNSERRGRVAELAILENQIESLLEAFFLS